VRAVEGLGCRMGDCLTRLESTTEAQASPGLRARMADEHQLTLTQVADVIDLYCRSEDEGSSKSIAQCVAQIREAVGCAAKAY
jgi:hypothetical protein